MELETPLINKKGLEKYELKDNEQKSYNIEYSYDEKNIYFELFSKGDILTEKYFLSLDLNTLKKLVKHLIY